MYMWSGRAIAQPSPAATGGFRRFFFGGSPAASVRPLMEEIQIWVTLCGLMRDVDDIFIYTYLHYIYMSCIHIYICMYIYIYICMYIYI